MNTRYLQYTITTIATLLTATSAHADDKTYTFAKEPVFFKGSGSCEGIELADLNQDGVHDIVSGVPNGHIHVYYGKKSDGKTTYGEKQILKNADSNKNIKVEHW